MVKNVEKLEKRIEVAKAAHAKKSDRASKKILKRAQRKLASTRASAAMHASKHKTEGEES